MRPWVKLELTLGSRNCGYPQLINPSAVNGRRHLLILFTLPTMACWSNSISKHWNRNWLSTWEWRATTVRVKDILAGGLLLYFCVYLYWCWMYTQIMTRIRTMILMKWHRLECHRRWSSYPCSHFPLLNKPFDCVKFQIRLTHDFSTTTACSIRKLWVAVVNLQCPSWIRH